MERFEFSDPQIRMIFSVRMHSGSQNAEQHKVSLTYRLLVLLEGGFTLRLNDHYETVGPGDIVFMPPHEEYRTVFFEGETHLLNIFFEFVSPKNPSDGMNYIGDFFITLPSDRAANFSERLEFIDFPMFNETFVVRGMADAAEKCRELYRMQEHGGCSARLRRNAGLCELLADLADFTNKEATDPGSRLAHAVIGYIKAHYSERLTCQSIAAQFAYHPNYINRVVRMLTGYPLHEYIIRVKLSHADRLLLETEMSITEIAHLLSFHDSSHFTKVYRAYMGQKPSERRCILLHGIGRI